MGRRFEGRMRFPLAVLQEVKNVVYNMRQSPLPSVTEYLLKNLQQGAADRGYL